MHKWEKEKMRSFLDTLSEANKEINAFLKANDTSQAATVLADCQDFIDALYDFLVEANGEDAHFKQLALEYLGYMQDAAALIHSGNYDRKGILGGLRKYVHALDAFISRIPAKKVVVFLPYKADMWDSLESIWRAARDDDEYETYVVPIPYYEKLPDGGLGTMHYDGGKFPDYVSITHFSKFSLDEVAPDITYIHNPYDENNYVTTVHPNYYSYELRKHTKLLVYSPYFVVDGMLDENMLRLPSFCNFDYILAQSEEMRRQYIQCMKTIAGKHAMPPGYVKNIEKRVLSLGSPKFDAVIHARREDFALPPEWMNKIAGKKVILYNTTIAALLRHNEQYIKKVKSVLETFKCTESVVLWWRPHPLILSTLTSMRPQLAREWARIVEEYTQEGWGIYDDTSELHRAIAWSDAYYGDGCSIAALYEASTKPMLLQDINVVDSICVPTFFYTYVDESYMYFTEETFNMLGRIHLQTYEVERLGEFPEESGDILFRKIEKMDDKLYFSPWQATKIGVYDIAKNQFCNGLQVKEHPEKALGGAGIPQAIAFDKSIYFFPFWGSSISKLDTQTNILEHFDPNESVLKFDRSRRYKVLYDGQVVNGSVFFIVSYTNRIIQFDFASGTSTVYEVGEKANRFASICFDGEDFWISPVNTSSPIVRWNPETGIKAEISEYFVQETSPECPFVRMYYWDGFVWLFPTLGNPPVKIDVRTNALSIADEFDGLYFENIRAGWLFQSTELVGDIFYAYQPVSGKIFEYSVKDKSMTEHTLYMDDALRSEYMYGRSFLFENASESRFFETPFLSIESYAPYVKRDAIDKALRTIPDTKESKNAGAEIYAFIRRQV